MDSFVEIVYVDQIDLGAEKGNLSLKEHKESWESAASTDILPHRNTLMLFLLRVLGCSLEEETG